MDNIANTTTGSPFDFVSRLLHRGGVVAYENEGVTIRDIIFGVFCFCIVLMCRLILWYVIHD